MAKPDRSDSSPRQLSFFLSIEGSKGKNPPTTSSKDEARRVLLKDLEIQGLRRKL